MRDNFIRRVRRDFPSLFRVSVQCVLIDSNPGYDACIEHTSVD